MKIFLSALVATIKWLIVCGIEVLASIGFYVLIGKYISWELCALLYILFCLVVDMYIMKGE